MSGLADYRAEVARKRVSFEPRGLAKIPPLNPNLMPHAEHGVVFGLERGCAGLFYDTGLHKTLQELEWGRVIAEAENRPVLMLAPLACAAQHAREAEKWGIDAKVVREPAEIDGARVYITNYDRAERFDINDFAGLVADDSAILKSFAGVMARRLIAQASKVKYRLEGNATPAPNDFMEIGQHSAFLGVMSQTEMLTRWFLHDSANTKRWYLKGWAVEAFWDWVATWSRAVSKPSDLGFSDDGFVMPPLNVQRHMIRADVGLEAGQDKGGQGRLFRMPEISATSIHQEKRLTLRQRVDKAAELVLAEPGEAWVLWCDTDAEADALQARLPDAIEVRGSQTIMEKERKLDAFATGQAKWIITKERIAGWGCNWQHCARAVRVGLSFSYEGFYQGARRLWRYGQTRPVDYHLIGADTEETVFAAIERKSADHEAMKLAMVAAMRRAARIEPFVKTYAPGLPAELPSFLRSLS